ncbi:MAG: efflux transporter, family, subunit [Bryobacterales bacterium]|nr:efflux transporter, family, subunit [Bryobacterales bacterium]
MVIGWFVYRQKTELPQVPFAKTARGRLASTLSTNGKVEPLEYTDLRVATPGIVARLAVRQGGAVAVGQVLAELSQPGQTEDLAGAEARLAQVRAELAALEAGGRSGDVAEIEGAQARLRTQRESAQRNLEALRRLVQANAATKFEAEQAEQAVRDIDSQLQSLSQKRGALVSKPDLDAARARIREAQANVNMIQGRIARNSVRSTAGGILYNLPIREGAFLNAGDLVGSVGKLDPVRVRVYVDEPELGRVATGQAVRITWDALPGREWTGKVEQKPTQVIALGSRQVGEVLCTIANPSIELVPGTNVNAFILTQVVGNALTIPRTALRRESGTGVYILDKATNTAVWRNVKTGASDALRIEVVSGLADNDVVAQPSDITLKSGLAVKPLIQ